MNTNHDYRIERIVLAFDSSGCNHFTIEHIFNIAGYLNSTIQAIYIEDNNLLNAAGLPFTREVALHTAQTRKLDSQQITRHFNKLASQLRSMLETQSQAANIPSSFRVTRGPMLQTILQESNNAQLVYLPAVSRIVQAGKRKYVVYISDNKSDLIQLRLCAFLASKFKLDVLIVRENITPQNPDLNELSNSNYPDIQFHQVQAENITTMINQLKHVAVELLVIPETHPLLQQPDQIQRIINNLKCDIMVSRGQIDATPLTNKQ